MPYQLVLKYLSSKTKFVFNQTLYTLFKERYAVITSSNFFLRPFWKSYSLTKAKFSLVNPQNPAKTEKAHGRITWEYEINGFEFPTLQGKVPPGTMNSQMPGACPGGGDVEGSIWPVHKGLNGSCNFSVYFCIYMWRREGMGEKEQKQFAPCPRAYPAWLTLFSLC